MHKERILDKFSARAKAIVDNTRNVGWGFHDYLADVYYDYFPDDIVE